MGLDDFAPLHFYDIVVARVFPHVDRVDVFAGGPVPAADFALAGVVPVVPVAHSRRDHCRRRAEVLESRWLYVPGILVDKPAHRATVLFCSDGGNSFYELSVVSWVLLIRCSDF